jgi:hypothetical protein
MRHNATSVAGAMMTNIPDEDAGKGAVESDRPAEKTNTSMAGQSGHRTEDPLVKSSDSDFPEPGQNEEHTGEPENHNELLDDSGCNPKNTAQNTDVAHRRK